METFEQCGIAHWTIINVDAAIASGERLKCDMDWLKNDLRKDDRIHCVCQNDGYYYDARVKKVEGAGGKRVFTVTYAGMKSRFDQKFNLKLAFCHFLPFNLQTLKYAMAYNAQRLAEIKKKVEKTGAVLNVEDFDKKGFDFLKNFDKIDRARISSQIIKFRVCLPPRYSIQELLYEFDQRRPCFNQLHPYTVNDFCAEFQAKLKENNFKNELFYSDEETNDVMAYCSKIKEQRSLKQNEEIPCLSFHFGAVHLLRYLFHLYEQLYDGEKSDANKKKFYLVHELARFISDFINLYYGEKEYTRS